ncbi:hypothetical protein, partial [Pseudomonas lopnurensis]|uniref:hypothetical protein n=1 Tax=Pseudomonas lopnurensis TaxID=1477517 RepID=UPI0028B1AD05
MAASSLTLKARLAPGAMVPITLVFCFQWAVTLTSTLAWFVTSMVGVIKYMAVATKIPALAIIDQAHKYVNFHGIYAML